MWHMKSYEVEMSKLCMFCSSLPLCHGLRRSFPGFSVAQLQCGLWLIYRRSYIAGIFLRANLTALGLLYPTMVAGPWPNVPVLLDRKVQMPQLLITEALFVTSGLPFPARGFKA